MNATQATAAARSEGSRERAHAAPRAVAIWLLVCCALLFAIVVVGGVTRLTHSGLSITEWQPIVGTVPPLSTAHWDEAFAKYQATPEYRQVNKGMSLAAFKSIFWWEYAHRLLGRAIGAVFALPLAWFVVRRKLPRPLVPVLLLILVLGGMQGALGWYMVQSGLVDDPRVSQLRLAAHLGLALLIFAAMFWLALSLLRPSADLRRSAIPRDDASLRRFALAIAALVFVQALAGSLVAGIRAGLAYNTFPLMNGQWVPTEILSLEPWYRNFVDNMATVQFVHRTIAWVLALLIPGFWLRVRASAPSEIVWRAMRLLLVALAVQVALGIGTLLLVVPVPLAAAHQAGAVLLFAAAINAAHALRHSVPRQPRT
ncbi:MAG TPA: COX15/CtaA family protein [Casimicrobiaceae bacterium]|jgi:cytochrome c oxidase assembly protein subunit 15